MRASRRQLTIRRINFLPPSSAGCALPASTTCTGRSLSATSRASRSGSEKSRPARLYVAKRRAKPIVSASGRRTSARPACRRLASSSRARSDSASAKGHRRRDVLVAAPRDQSRWRRGARRARRRATTARVDAVRDAERSERPRPTVGQRRRHISRQRRRATPTRRSRARRPQRQRRQAEQVRVVSPTRPDREKVVVTSPLSPTSQPEIALDERRVEDLVSGRDRRVRREQTGRDAAIECALERSPPRQRRAPARSRGTPSGPRSCGRRSGRARARGARARRRRRARAPAGAGARGRRRRACR